MASAGDTALELGTHLRRTQAGESIAFLPEQTKTKGGLAVTWTHPRGVGASPFQHLPHSTTCFNSGFQGYCDGYLSPCNLAAYNRKQPFVVQGNAKFGLKAEQPPGLSASPAGGCVCPSGGSRRLPHC